MSKKLIPLETLDLLNAKTSQALAISHFIQQHYEDNGYQFLINGEIVNNALWAVTSLLEEASKAQEGLNNA